MPFSRPTLSDITARVQADIEARLGLPKLLYRSVLAVLATAVSAVAHTLHGHIAWAADQLFPDTAAAENLARWASIWAVSRKAASFATGAVTFTGTNGTTVPEGTELQRSDGARYLTTADGMIASGTLTLGVQAVDAGTGGNAAAGVTLGFLSPLAGVNASATVAAGGLAGGEAVEGDDSLRARLLTRIQSPPHGGADFDYRAWALDVAGVTRAFVYPGQNGIGTVGVAILTDEGPAGPVAPSGLVADTQAHINAVRPVTADVTVWTPTAVPLAFSIHIVPDTTAVRAAVEASLRELLGRVAEPGKTILLSQIREAVSTAAGEVDNTVSVPSGNFAVTSTQLAVMGAITWL